MINRFFCVGQWTKQNFHHLKKVAPHLVSNGPPLSTESPSDYTFGLKC